MRSCCLTDIGVKRKMNQDFVYASDQPVGPLPNLLIVADGMGGHNAGDYASRCAVGTMVDFIENTELKKPVPIFDAALQAANAAILAKSRADRTMEGMGTTLVAATVIDGCMYVLNVGDSRLYLLDETISQVTHDHSLVEEMVARGDITRAQARTHPEKNVITRAVGVREPVRADYFDVALQKGDIILLCSDGLTNMVEDSDIYSIISKASSPEDAAAKLVREANKNGGTDNISVVLGYPEDAGDKLC